MISFQFIKMFVDLSGEKKAKNQKQQQQQNVPLKNLIPDFVALLVISGIELSSKLSKNSFEIPTKREAAAIVLVGFRTGEFCYSMSITNSPLVEYPIKIQDLY